MRAMLPTHASIALEDTRVGLQQFGPKL